MKTKPVPFSQVPEGGTLSVTKKWNPAFKRGNRAILCNKNGLYELSPNTIVYVQI